MSVSSLSSNRLALPGFIGLPMGIGGVLAIFATYWDEAFHTDVGRDSAWAAPHVLLYGSVALVGLGVALWGLRALAATRSLRSCLAHPPLTAAGLGALGALAAAPVDAAWHEAYGRDAVLWSPPHMLVVLASTSLVLGVLAGLPARTRALRAGTGVILLANAAAVVFEYEADVPQFHEALYLPVLLTVGLPTVWAVRRMVPLRFPATTVVLGYVVLRLGVMVGLTALGRSTPDLPIAVLGLAAYDLPARRASTRLAAAAVATSTLAWLASAGSWASPVASDVALSAVPVIVIGAAVLLAGHRRGLLVAPALMLAAGALLTASPRPALAHDPGQGAPIADVDLRVTSDTDRRVTLAATAGPHCEDLTPELVVARRAAQTLTSPLLRTGPCRFTGSLTVPTAGRWFVYAELTHDGEPAESWLPVDVGSGESLAGTRVLYRPAGVGDAGGWVQAVSGGVVYALGLFLLGVGVRAVRSRPA